MASFLERSLSLCVLAALLISPGVSLTCTTQKVTDNNVPYSQCLDLPALNAYLHYSYLSSNTTLSVAFIASPATQDGWIAWAINPSDMGMIGAQALVAYKDKNGAVTVKTYSIKSYSSLVESKLSFDVWDTKAEDHDGKMTIFAKIKVPMNLAAKGKVNQVWQVGAKVTNGQPERHDFAAPNLSSKADLQLEGKAAESPAPASNSPAAGTAAKSPAPASNSPPAGTAADTPAKGGVSRIGSKNVGIYLGLVFVFIGSFIGF